MCLRFHKMLLHKTALIECCEHQGIAVLSTPVDRKNDRKNQVSDFGAPDSNRISSTGSSFVKCSTNSNIMFNRQIFAFQCSQTATKNKLLLKRHRVKVNSASFFVLFFFCRFFKIPYYSPAQTAFQFQFSFFPLTCWLCYCQLT